MQPDSIGNYDPDSVEMKEVGGAEAVEGDGDAGGLRARGVEWRADLDGYVTSLVEVAQDADLTELLKGLPGDRCPSPHWGYVIAGRDWWRFEDREESFGPGEAFYVEPGHTAGADAGSQFVIFSPAEIMAEVDAHMSRRAQEMQGA